MKLNYSIIISAVLLFFSTQYSFAQISIASARTMTLGSTVTVNGIVTTDAGFGTIRYIQDGTAGIALFDIQLSSATRGDSISVTGTLTDFQNLLEITNVTNFSVISTGNPLPAPILITPLGCDETQEGELIQINGVTFNSPTGNFAGNTTYSFTANGENGEVYIINSNPIVGSPIPASTVNLIGICTQFANSYQVLPRDINDLISTSSLSFTVSPYASNITSSSFNINWETNLQTNSFINYGFTPGLELGILSGSSASTSHTVSINGATPSQLFYAQAFSVAGTDTLFGAIQVYITASVSTGQMKVYFTQGVDHSKANNLNNFAVQLPNAFADTIAYYISNANQSIDIAIYNFSDVNTSPIINALNNAYASGKQIRVVTEKSNTNSGIMQLNINIPVILSETGIGFGIMHNKFVVIDEATADPLDDIIISGSTNWTNDQLNIDRNNLVIIQDKSLAIAYTIEFEEMWGSTSAQPDTLNARFGPDKKDNTPHLFNINGKMVESYFSPSDNTNNKIKETINTADSEAYFALLSFTRSDLAQTISDRVLNNGVYAAGIMNDTSSASGPPFLIIQTAIGSNMQLFNAAALPGIMHHKYLIVDQSNSNSDPLVLTGSHNWSTSANSRNDENTLIIHDENIANQFYQEFADMMKDNGISVGVENINNVSELLIYPNPFNANIAVQFTSSFSEALNYFVSDITGKAFFSDTYVTIIGENNLELSLNALSSGIYFIHMYSKSGTAVNKIIRK